MLNVDLEKCTACGACINSCSVNALSWRKDERGFCYPEIEQTACVKCGLCEKVCPVNKKEQLETSDWQQAVYAAYSQDDDIRKSSSSGGVFSILAQYVLQQNGIVYGAAFDDQFNVAHIGIKTIEDLPKLRGSKYVQSYILETLFAEIKKELQQGRLVLFSGTPCQVAGLKLYLQKKYDNLLLADLICHGVPSGKVFSEYLNHLERKQQAKCTSYNFRDKKKGWKSYFMSAFFSKPYRANADLDPYMYFFMRGVFQRPSCYQCQYTSVKRVSDITLADFWGIKPTKTIKDDDKGISLILVNTPIGAEAFDKCKPLLVWEERKIEEALAGQNHLTTPSPCNQELSSRFWSLFCSEGFDSAVSMHKYSFTQKIKFLMQYYAPWLFLSLKKICKTFKR